MTTKTELEARVAELESDFRQRDDKIKELRDDLDDLRELNGKMREHIEDRQSLMDSWKEAFRMEAGDDGNLHWSTGPGDIADDYDELRAKHSKLVRDYNKLVKEWNVHFVSQTPGRPLAASEAQVEAVRRLRKGGLSLRAIVAATSLGFRTVRTITEKDTRTDRTSKRDDEQRKRMLDKMRAAAWRERKRSLDQLPNRIAATQHDGAELIKAAKGLADDG